MCFVSYLSVTLSILYLLVFTFLPFSLFSYLTYFCLSLLFVFLPLFLALIPFHWLKTRGGGLLELVLVSEAESGWVMTAFSFFFFFIFLQTTNQEGKNSFNLFYYLPLEVGDRHVKIITYVEHLIIFCKHFFPFFSFYIIFSNNIGWHVRKKDRQR